jgi:hypothetical protein
MTIAALFVDPRGAYSGLVDVDVWDAIRDARAYQGPHAVVAHPPCARWCQLARLVEARYGHRVGDDGGCFASALAAVRTYGGVLEHPAESIAWSTFELRTPHRWGGWLATRCGGWVCQVEQGHFGHPARKRTWLYVHGGDPRIFTLPWGPSEADALVSWCDQTNYAHRPRVSKAKASATPPAFRDLLLLIASQCAARSDAIAPEKVNS